VAAEDTVLEIRSHARHLDLHHHLGLVGPRRAGNPTRRVAVGRPHRPQRAVHGTQLGAQALVATGVESPHPVFRERSTGLGLDPRALIAHGLANEDALAFGLIQRPTRLVEHLSQHPVGDGFAVDQHAVAIEQHRIETITDCP